MEIHYDNREYRMKVRDDGKGIDRKVLDAGRKAGHHGLPGMHRKSQTGGWQADDLERAGFRR